jgi:hypothetical protein
VSVRTLGRAPVFPAVSESDSVSETLQEMQALFQGSDRHPLDERVTPGCVQQ